MYNPSKAWDLSQLPAYFTPRTVNEIHPTLQSRLSRREFTQVAIAYHGVVSMSFTLDGGSVTFFDQQGGPITQTVRSADTGEVKKSVVLDVPYRLVGVAMQYGCISETVSLADLTKRSLRAKC
jgi:hypothetical protein